jgi:hypothetical protein
MFCFRSDSMWTKSKCFVFVPIISFDIGTFVLPFWYHWHYYCALHGIKWQVLLWWSDMANHAIGMINKWYYLSKCADICLAHSQGRWGSRHKWRYWSKCANLPRPQLTTIEMTSATIVQIVLICLARTQPTTIEMKWQVLITKYGQNVLTCLGHSQSRWEW